MTLESIDLLLTNGTVLTMNPAGDIITNGAVAVRNDAIIDLGPADTLAAKYAPAKTINCGGGVISPGMVNAHTHVPMTLLRGLSDDLRLDVWLYGFMMPVEREFVTPEFSYTGTLLACAEMIRGGITTFCDMYYYEDQVADATAKAGMRAICAQTILKFPSPDANSYDDSLVYAQNFIRKWKGHPLIIPAVAPHAPYTATPEMLQACADLAVKYDVPIHVHVAETELEQSGSRDEYGVTVVPWLEKYGIFNAKVIAAHGVHLDDDEMETLKAHNAGVAHCPSSNLKLASGVAPVSKMLGKGLNVGVGTDGPASNNDLDMVEEIRLASFLQKGVFGDPTLLPAKQAWELATIRGAKALHIDHLTGSLEVGKRADIAVIDLNAPHQTPHFRHSADAIYAQLVYAARATDVQHVVVNGQVLLENRQLLTLDEKDLLKAARVQAEKIDRFLSTREEDLLSKLLAVGSGMVPMETYEVQGKLAVNDLSAVETRLGQPPITITASSVRNQYDAYLTFNSNTLGRIRYREDEILQADNTIQQILYTVTLTGPTVERVFDNSVILNRSRYSLPADKSLRFYREYFQPDNEVTVKKARRRYHVNYKAMHFVVNLDHLASGEQYVEIKTRTWSANDAQTKAQLISELFGVLTDNAAEMLLHKEYLDLV